MSIITMIEVSITTGNNGTLGAVYLGIGGREFRLNRLGQNDFMQNNVSQFVLGDASHAFSVVNPAANDPKKPLPLDSADLELYPIYLRLAGANGHWKVASGMIKVHAGPGSQAIRILPHGTELLLGPDCGELLFVRPPGV
jgi:hypothetical protein